MSLATPVTAEDVLPQELLRFENHQTAIPAMAKDPTAMATIAESLLRLPTQHRLIRGDARELDLPPNSVDLVVTSPPYWTLKRYADSEAQLGHFEDYELRVFFRRVGSCLAV